MKRVTICLLLAAFGSSQLLAQESPKPEFEKVAENFMERLLAGDTDEVFELFDSRLTAEVDPPILMALINGAQKELGPFESFEVTDVSQQEQGDVVLDTLSATFKHEGAESLLQLTLLKDKIISFSLKSDDLQDWFHGPQSTEFYEDQCEAFIQHFIDGDEKQVRKMCHPALLEQVDEKGLAPMFKFVQDKLGELESQQLIDSNYEENDKTQKLRLNYLLKGDQGELSLKITFQFVGMRGHLLAFSWK